MFCFSNIVFTITVLIKKESKARKSTEGRDGEYIMSNDWYQKFVYQIVIDKKFLDSKTLKVLDKKPIVCPLWDPFGSLAIT